jgi:hypothetical protein
VVDVSNDGKVSELGHERTLFRPAEAGALL